MFQPLMHPIGDIGFVFAHMANPPGHAATPYAVAAIRLSPAGVQTEYSSLIRCPLTRARDYMHSHVSRRQLAAAPPHEQVREELCAFLAGLECVLCFDPYDAAPALKTLLDGTRLFDLGFAADFFMPWASTASPRQMWEVIHGQPRDKVSFSAEEGAELCLSFTRHLFGTVLADSRFPGARSLRHYLAHSDTLFGDMCRHLMHRHGDYFGGGLVPPVTAEDTADWQQFLEQAPAVDKQAGNAPSGGQAFTPVPEKEIRQLYEQLAHTRKGYRVREPQVAYAGHVAHALNTNAVACLEAGTGTGKTLGYLLPVMEFLKRNPGQRVAIATYTKSLQNQLHGNELEACRTLFGQYRSIPSALIKGKSNYVCAAKLDDVLSPDLRGPGLLAWLFFVNICFRYRLADCEDISPRLRKRLDADRQLTSLMLEVSAGSGCHATHTRCPAQVVTAEAANARLVITNHNKLILMEKDGKLSGLFRHCIIDEANHFEDAVRSAMSPEIAASDVRGHVRYLREQCRRLCSSPSTPEPERRKAESAVEAMGTLLRAMDDLRDKFLSMDRGALGGAVSIPPAHNAFSGGSFAHELKRLHALMESVHEHTALFAGKESARLPMHYKALSRCRTMRTLVHESMFSLAQLRTGLDSEGTWQSVQVFPRSWTISGGHVYVGPLVRNHILSRRDTVVFTSATLTHQASFDPFRRSLGLGKGTQPVIFDNPELPPKPRFVTRVAPPFEPDFSLVVPSGAPTAVFEHKTAWLNYAAQEIPRLIDANHGATLVLCASYDDLEALRERLEQDYDGEYPLLFQKKGEPPAALCDEFRAARESVLFGVETFWHGVDFPGDTLTQVIITRLPYPSPASPLMDARRRCLPEAAYWDRYRYETAIKFRQGMGRLIRRETDSGIVVVLDNRLLANRNLAPCPIIEGLHNLPERHRRGRR